MPSNFMLKKNKPLLLLTAGAAILLISGAIVAYLLVQRKALQGQPPAEAKLIPQDALVTATISTNPQQWQQLREYGTPESRAALDAQLVALRDQFLTANGYNYQQDIQPWLGKEVTVAYLPSGLSAATNNPTNSPATQQSMVMVLPIDNPVTAQQLLEKPKASNVGKFVERTYKGVQIRERQGASSQYVSTTVLGHYLVVTTDPQATERVIDTSFGNTSLATTPGYREALGQIHPSQPFAQFYLNVPVAAATAAASSGRELSPGTLEQLQQKQGVAVTMTLESEGIRFSGISWLKSNSQKKLVVENNALTMPNLLPASTVMMISGGNLKQLWKDYVDGVQSNPLAPIKPEEVRANVKSFTSLDVDQDLMPWMAGEFSLSLIPAPQGTPSNLGAGIVFMVQASGRAAAEKSLTQLDQFLAQQYQYKVQETKVGNQVVVNLTSPEGGFTATQGWLDGNVAFMALGAPVVSLIVPQPKATLANSELFKKTVPIEPNPNNGNFFIDLDRTINSGNLALPQLPPQQKKLTLAMRSIGVTAGVRDERSSRFDIFVLLRKVGLVPPFPSPSASATRSPSPKVSNSPSSSR